jgi:hypothetical protein
VRGRALVGRVGPPVAAVRPQRSARPPVRRALAPRPFVRASHSFASRPARRFLCAASLARLLRFRRSAGVSARGPCRRAPGLRGHPRAYVRAYARERRRAGVQVRRAARRARPRGRVGAHPRLRPRGPPGLKPGLKPGQAASARSMRRREEAAALALRCAGKARHGARSAYRARMGWGHARTPWSTGCGGLVPSAGARWECAL